MGEFPPEIDQRLVLTGLRDPRGLVDRSDRTARNRTRWDQSGLIPQLAGLGRLWKLTNEDLHGRADKRYEGRILRVEPQKVFNQWKYTKEEIVPVITFDDGLEWIPNIGARRALTQAWGPDTDQRTAALSIRLRQLRAALAAFEEGRNGHDGFSEIDATR